MLRKTKVRIASVLSLVTGVLVFPRPSAAVNWMPAPDRTSVQRSAAPAAQGTIATSSIKGVLNRDQQLRFNRQFGDRTSITTRELINFVVGQQKMNVNQAPGVR